jgi:hypothetical protein
MNMQSVRLSPSKTSAIEVWAGAMALAHLKREGLRPRDVHSLAAAAGGPKGLALIPFDQYLFSDWLNREPSTFGSRQLFGASIGAWRMAAGSRQNNETALTRLSEAYLECQRYNAKPSTQEVAQVCREVVRGLIDHNADQFFADHDARYDLHVIVARTEKRANYKPLMATAAINNSIARERLARQMQRIVYTQASSKNRNALYSSVYNPNESVFQNLPSSPSKAFESTGFNTEPRQFIPANMEDALLASGTIPMVADPVLDIFGSVDHKHPRAIEGAYWDGGLIDYHLWLNYQQLPGLVLYPHFGPTITAGWLDKFLPWRKHGIGSQGQHWLDNLILIAPSPALIAQLPNKKIPDRQDFYNYGLNHDQRIKDWRTAMSQCEAIPEAFARLIEKQEFDHVKLLPT